jgi:hypothetical protein
VVISAAGGLHSPALLLRSGVSCRGNVGANLRIHPCTCVLGVFPEERDQLAQGQAAGTAGGGPAKLADAPATAVPDLEDLVPSSPEAASAVPAQQQAQHAERRRLHMGPASGGSRRRGAVRGWEGPIMSIFSTQAGDWEGSGYGCLLFTSTVSIKAPLRHVLANDLDRQLPGEQPSTLSIAALIFAVCTCSMPQRRLLAYDALRHKLCPAARPSRRCTQGCLPRLCPGWAGRISNG